VEDRRYTHPLTHAWVDSAVAAGFKPTDDFNGAEQEGAGPFQLTQKRGRRWSCADAFLHPVADRPNLVVQTGAHARRIVLDGGRATGVEYEYEGTPITARADREVVVSAGAINSPQLLMLSGIGPAEHLREHGIEAVVDSPHVGAGLQDHPLVTLTWEVDVKKSLLDATKPVHLLHYVVGRGKGMLSSNVGEAGVHVRIRDGIDEQSATRRPSTPRTRSCASSTPSSSRPIRQVQDAW